MPIAGQSPKEVMHTEMHEFKEGKLHSGSKHGPKVTSRKQAIAIGLSESHQAIHRLKKAGAISERASKRVAKRADGGPLQAGQASVVGERGPELFVPNKNGNVIPNDNYEGGTPDTLNVRLSRSPSPAVRELSPGHPNYVRGYSRGGFGEE